MVPPLSARCESGDQGLLGHVRCLWVREIGQREGVGGFKSVETGERKLRTKSHEPLDKAPGFWYAKRRAKKDLESHQMANVGWRLWEHFRTCDDEKASYLLTVGLNDGRPVPSVHR